MKFDDRLINPQKIKIVYKYIPKKFVKKLNNFGFLIKRNYTMEVRKFKLGDNNYILTNSVGVPVPLDKIHIDPTTITNKFYIGAHIAWKNSRCAGEDYGATAMGNGSGVIFDIGSKHFFVLTDIEPDSYVKMHFNRAFCLDSVGVMDIKFIGDNDPRHEWRCKNPQKYLYTYNYVDYKFLPNSKTTLIRKNSDKYSQYDCFLEEGQLYDHFKHRNMNYGPCGLDVFNKIDRFAFIMSHYI